MQDRGLHRNHIQKPTRLCSTAGLPWQGDWKGKLMTEPIVIWGAGAIGGTIGAYLARAGHEVLMVDVAADHVARMQAEGLTVEGPIDAFTVPVRAVTPDQLEGRYRRVLLAVKAQHTTGAVDTLKPFLTEDGYVVSVQNGLNEMDIAAVVGAERTIGCFINFGADYEGPGHILFGGRGAFVLGETDGRMTERLKELHSLICDFEPDAQVTDNIFGYLWAKLSFAAVLQAHTVSNEPIEQFLDNPRWRPMLYRLVHEVAVTAQAEGVSLMTFQGFDPNEFLDRDVARMKTAIDNYAEARRGSKKLYSGIWRDIVVRKRQTEIGLQGEPVLRAAQKHGIDGSTYATSLRMIREVEQGRAELGEALASKLLAIARTADRK